MAVSEALIVEPPAISRFRESSADQEVVGDLADTIKSPKAEGKWVTSLDTYKTHKEASLDAGVYKRAVARALGVADYKIRTRTWGMRNGKVELDTEAKGATWQYALRFDPTREKKVKNKS